MAEPGGQRDLPTVSIIMNCLDCARYLPEALDSAYSQTYTDWEIVFWDNASTDESADIARGYGEKLRYFRSDETYPLGKARNLALEQARGKYMAFLDCDDVWLPQKLEKQIPLFEANPRVGLVFCDTIFFNQKGRRRRLYANGKPPRGHAFRELLVGYNISMETVVVRRQALEGMAEWFDPRFNMIEEKDMFLRIAHDWELDYVDEPLAMWRVHGASWSWAKKELFPQETRLMLEKFSSRYPDFENRFGEELSSVESQLEYQYAMLDWEMGHSNTARRRLRPYLFASKKYLAVYFLSLFPYPVYRRGLGLFRVLP